MEGVVWRLVSTWVFFQIGECRFVAEANKNRDIKIKIGKKTSTERIGMK